MKQKLRKILLAAVCSLAVFAGCQNEQKADLIPNVTATPTKVSELEVTPELTKAPTEEPTQKPTVTQKPTATPAPTVTPVPTKEPEPTKIPTPTPEYYTPENWKDAGVGAKIKFGSYEQDNNIKNGAEEIEWLVIDEDEENLLIVSTYALESMPFMESDGAYVNWEDSFVRKWMQEEFYPNAFTDEEKQSIVRTTLDHWFIGNYGDEFKKFDEKKLESQVPLDDTEDYVFLLAYREYSKSADFIQEAVMGNVSSYVEAKGYDKGVRAGSERILNWLRPGGYPDKTSYFGYISEKEIQTTGTTDQITSRLLVNPAMWIAKEGAGTEKNFYTDETVFEIIESADGIMIAGLNDETYTQVSIPKTIKGKKVIGIIAGAFNDNDTIRRIKIPENVYRVDKSAFRGCDNLVELFLPSTLKNFDEELFEITTSICHIETAKDAPKAIKQLANRYTNRELKDFIFSDTERAGLWSLTYAEFIEMYQSIGTENDLFVQMLEKRGPCHVDKTGIYYEYDKMKKLTYTFSDVTTEKIYALHYAPFEYNYEDLARGRYEKELEKAYADHGGVCGVLAIVGMDFIRNVLGETDWSYVYYLDVGVNHKVLLIQVEDGRIFQIDNAETDSWWLGLNFIPDYEIIEPREPDAEVVKVFETWQGKFEDAEEMLWYDFSIRAKGRTRRIWYNYDTKSYETCYYNITPNAYKVEGLGLQGKILSMAGYFKKEGYVDLSEIPFYSTGVIMDYIKE